MKIYCLVCNNEFEADALVTCPHCGAVGDDLEEIPNPDFPQSIILIVLVRNVDLKISIPLP